MYVFYNLHTYPMLDSIIRISYLKQERDVRIKWLVERAAAAYHIRQMNYLFVSLD